MNPKQWLENGIACIPIQYYGKRPHFQAFKSTGDLDENGRPSWKKYQTVLPIADQLKTWFQSRFTNIAVVTGWQNLVIVDFDEWSIWKLWEGWIINKYPDMLDNTYRVKTSRGMHVYFFIEEPPKRTLRLPKIDVKAGGGYCLCPDSIHPNGHKYRANMNDLKIITIDHLSDVMPDILLQQATQEIVIPECNHHTSCEINVWNVTPRPQNGNGSIDWIKNNRSILEFFPNARQTGNDYYMVHCPLHNDHVSSASINIKTNRIKCFKNCFGDRGSDIIDFYCLLKNIDRKQAIRELSNGT